MNQSTHIGIRRVKLFYVLLCNNFQHIQESLQDLYHSMKCKHESILTFQLIRGHFYQVSRIVMYCLYRINNILEHNTMNLLYFHLNSLKFRIHVQFFMGKRWMSRGDDNIINYLNYLIPNKILVIRIK